MELRATALTTLLTTLVVVAMACGVSAGEPGLGYPGGTPDINRQPGTIDNSALTSRWGETVRWKIGNADWSIELPDDGAWDFGDPFDPAVGDPAHQLISATYRSSTANGTEPYIFVDIVRLELSTLPEPWCSSPTVVSPDGDLISTPQADLVIAGHRASVTRITGPAADGSSTGSYQLCFVTATAMYQLISGARPGSATQDMFFMLTSFKLEN